MNSPTGPQPDAPREEHLSLTSEEQRMEQTLKELSARIARLAIGLGVSLETEDEIAKAMSHHTARPVDHERRTTPDRRGAARAGMTADRRRGHLHDELRGLLVMRYDIEVQYVDAVGVVAARHILMEAQAHLTRDGFQSGTTGIHLDRLFKDTE